MVGNDISKAVECYASEQPTQTALVFGKRRTSYAELDRYINQVANGLLGAGLTRQDRVAVFDLSSDQFYEVWLGAARIGVVNVPLNARATAAEVAVVLRDCKPRVVFVGVAHAALLDQIRPELEFVETVIVLGEAFEQWRDAQSVTLPTVSADNADVCLQLYTSGTTGKPKGVQLTNDNIRAAFDPLDRNTPSPWTSLDATDVVLVVLPHGHIAGAGMGLAGIHSGATLVVVREFDPAELVSIIQQEKVTTFMMVPMMIRALMGALALKADGGEACRSLKRIVYGAAPMAAATLKQAMVTFPGVEFGQVYGLTETSGPITYLAPADHRAIAAGNDRLALSCGRPLPDVDVRIVDQNGDDVSIDVIGEVICRSCSVMKGYWGRDEDNAAALREGWFHTGDLASIDAAGYFYLHDRKRDMVITGGENVFPAEVENALFSHPAISEAAVFGVPDDKWGEAVRAAVVLKPGALVSEADIVAYLKKSMAGFKVPKAIDFVDSLPRNPTGKVLRRILREPYWRDQVRQVS